MDVPAFAAFQRAYQQLSADNQAVIDWSDDTDFRLSVSRRELRGAVELMRRLTTARISILPSGLSWRRRQ
jgi:hypothetical protein